MQALLDSCRALAHGEKPTLTDIARVLATAAEPGELTAMLRPDPGKPYGRNVFLASDTLEGMVATWTREVPCAPHDHGGSVGGVRVLQGAAIHRVWDIVDGAMTLKREERVEAGQILRCGPDLVHSMADAGDADPLVTLHLYTDPIEFMVVYDMDRDRTVTVDGGCGAWVPHDRPEQICSTTDGMLRRAELLAHLEERKHAVVAAPTRERVAVLGR